MIVPMKRLTLVAHKSDESDILKALQRLDAVEVIPGEEASATSVLDVAEERVQRLSGRTGRLLALCGQEGHADPAAGDDCRRHFAGFAGGVVVWRRGRIAPA